MCNSHTAIRDEQMEMLYQMEQAWDALYVIDISENKSVYRTERINVIHSVQILMNEFGITKSELTEYRLLRRKGN